MKRYHGSCHCGQVRFEVTAEITRLTRCNCSVCTKKGTLNLRVSPEQFQLISGEDALRLYQFNKKIARHYFCGTCGMHAFFHPRAAPEQYTVNVNCLDDFDLDAEAPEIVPFDGQHWEAAVEGFRFK